MAVGHLVLLAIVSVSSAQDAWPFSMWRENAMDKFRELVQKRDVTELPKFYHTTKVIDAELDTLAKNCPGMTLERSTNGDLSVTTVHFKAPDTTSVKHRTMVVAGEHARELIGTETALEFTKELCKGSEQTKNALQETEFLIVLNANPISRTAVEKGDFCLRASPHGIDINRNWDVNWNTVGEVTQDTNPGPKAFSEPETQILKELMDKFKPHTFLDIHSGNLGLYLPNKLAQVRPHTKSIEKMLVEINSKNCKCPLGIANEEVGYQTCGSSLDYSYEKMGAQFAIAMEVFVDKSRMKELRESWDTQKRYLARPEEAASSFLELLPNKPIFIESDAHSDAFEKELKAKGPNFCFSLFNPASEDLYKKTVTKWTTTLLELTSVGRDVPLAPKDFRLKVEPMVDDAPALQTHQGTPLPLKIGAVLLLVLALGWVVSRMSTLWSAHKKAAEAHPLLQQQMGPIQVHD